MIYFLVAYASVFFTSLTICMSIFYQFLLLVRDSNYLLKNDTTGKFSVLPEIKVTFFAGVKIFLGAMVLSAFVGWRIVFKALLYDDFIIVAAKRLYIEVLTKVRNVN